MAPLIELTAVSKSYGGVPALTDVSLTVEPGAVHAILGENGAGKSTLMKLLAGVIAPETGTIAIDGQVQRFATPRDAARCGIVCMFQELSLMPHLSVGDNMLIGDGGAALALIRRGSRRAARAVLDRVGGQHIAMATRIADLPLADRQLVEIAKAIGRKPRLLILDEATSALTAERVETVFAVIRALRDAGCAVLFISHRMYEIDAVADRISIFRNGRHIETFAAGTRSHDAMISLMIGQSLKELFPPRRDPPPVSTPPILSVRDLRWAPHLNGVDLDVRPGEIVGLGGLDGQGQQHLMHAIFGILRRTSGTVTLEGKTLTDLTPGRAKTRRIGLALVPEDRKTEGLILDMTIADNLRLAGLSRKPFGLANATDATDAAIAKLIERLGLTYGRLSDPVKTLSGGNQQKVVLAKWLALGPRCLLLMDPTRGIDVKTKAQIYRLLQDLAGEGLAIVLQSTDYEELIHLCHRINVFYKGRVVRELSGAEATPDALIAASLNVSAEAA
ncbi:sugar ABC transporter ATP-binding protein [Lichenifustis flavocetrariae]|uniref:Sugar ABC transporter ATP-binding protein n=1 Tax=Lichenifustis flavocetrariae TaxID=2949735 RepID=A0AA41Z1P9_9HYPH|nr:sugar ABC transporter ATP-binding protein [Lichenifustis flavocetrariae]MCW6508755.1 sugar ABC transporter ATP-binding protein [Lichenifustis flavocetrariae]